MGRIYHHRVALLSGCILTVLLCHPVIGVPCEYGFENSTYLQQQMYFDGSFYGYAYCTDCLDPFQNLTACFWMKSNHTDTNGTVFTIFDSQGSEIRLQSYQFELCINHDCNSSAIKVADGSWHFVCSTWQSLEGEWQLYIDGVRVHQSLISSQANFEFLNLSALIIGQHWSYFVYDNSSDYHGYLTFFNLWPSVLDSLTMNELSTGCEYRLYQNCGDLFSWIVDANYLETSGSTVEVSQADNCYVGVPCNTPWGNSTYRDQQIGLDGWTASYVVCEECLVSSFQDLTACFWMKSNTTTNTSGAIFSVFDLWNNENKDIRLLDNSFRFCIKKNCDSSTIYVTDNDWHFVCSAWQSSDGEWRLYMDGVEVHRSLILPHVNSAFAEGLTLALGQDYSSFMFGNGSSYHGYLAFFNLWMDVLDIYTMNTLSTGCEYWYNQNCGNLFSWVHDGNHFQESYVDVSEAENCEYDPACGLPWANSTYRDQQIYFDQSSTSYVSCVGCLHHAFQNFTACFWMKSNNTDTNGTIFSIFDNSGETDDEIRLQSYHFKLCINNDCSASNSSSGSPVHAADGNWHFVCVMWQALHGEWRLYINGDDGYQSFIISQTNSTFPEGLSLVLGQSLSGLVNGNGGDGYYGYLAFFNLWSEIPSDIDFIGLSTAATGCYDDYQTVCGDLFSWVTDGNSFGLSSVEVSTADNCWFDESNCGAPWGYSAYGGEQIFFNGTSSNVLCEGCLDEAFQDFSACFWMRSNNTYTIGTVFSIFDSFGNTQDSIQLQSHSFELCINDDCETSAHHANDGEWHFVCSTWKSVSGDWRLYVDNIEVHHSSIPSQKSTTFASGLTLVLGTFVSGMVQDDGKGYHGYMTSFNLWNHVLGVAVIDTMDRFCVHRNPICGDLFSWQLDGNNFIVEYVDVFEDDRCGPYHTHQGNNNNNNNNYGVNDNSTTTWPAHTTFGETPASTNHSVSTDSYPTDSGSSIMAVSTVHGVSTDSHSTEIGSSMSISTGAHGVSTDSHSTEIGSSMSISTQSTGAHGVSTDSYSMEMSSGMPVSSTHGVSTGSYSTDSVSSMPVSTAHGVSTASYSTETGSGVPVSSTHGVSTGSYSTETGSGVPVSSTHGASTASHSTDAGSSMPVSTTQAVTSGFYSSDFGGGMSVSTTHVANSFQPSSEISSGRHPVSLPPTTLSAASPTSLSGTHTPSTSFATTVTMTTYSGSVRTDSLASSSTTLSSTSKTAPPTALSSLPKSTTTSVAASSAVSTYSPTTVTALSPTVSSSPTTDLTTAIASSTQYSYTDITTSSENASGGHSSASHNSTLQTSSRTPQTSPGKTASKTNTTQSNGGHPGVTNSSSHTTNEKLANLEVEATNCSDVVSCNSVLTQLHDLLGNGQSDGESVNTEKAVTVFSQAINPQSLSSKDITKEEKLSVVETTIQTCGSLLDVTNGNLWSSDNSNEDDSSHLADLVVAMDTFTDGIMTYINTDLNVTISVQTDNIELQAKSVDIATIGNSSVSLGTDKSNITMPTSLWIDSGFTNVSVVFVHYKTLDQINSQLSNDVKSDVISLSATPLPEIPFAEDISITLQVEEVSTGSLVCGYLDYTTTPSEWKTDGCQATTSGDGQVTCDCNHMTNFALLMQMVDFEVSAPDSAALTWISRVGSVFSLIALVITFVVILLIRLSSDRAMILLNLCVSLFFAQLLFIVGAKAVSYEALCKTVAIALHYLFLVVFFWMLVEGIQLLTKVRNVMWRAKTTMIWYAVIGWVFPAVIVIITVGIRFEYYASGDSCWISQEDGVIFSFVGPVLAVIVINISVLVVVLRTFLSVKANAKKKDIEKIKASIRAAVVLVPLLGVTWIFGVFAISKQTIFFQYLFVILNSLQGVFIFIFHCLLNEEVKTSFRRKYRKGSKVGSKTGKTTGCNNESMTTTSTGTATSM
ncbi:uncharacterized protein [Ptychodera flava]|uniref:uncharacterized protein isoform X1 n=1 Tax=Ptychodera flava TaxID=63121 RepID=UPI00396A471E